MKTFAVQSTDSVEENVSACSLAEVNYMRGLAVSQSIANLDGSVVWLGLPSWNFSFTRQVRIAVEGGCQR